MANNDLIKQAIALLQQALSEAETPTPGPVPVPEPTPVPEPVPAPPPVKAITSIEVVSLSNKPQENVPFTIGHPFKKGDLAADSGLQGRWENGETIPLQIDVKALHSDGSVRHAIVSGIVPTLFGKETRKIELLPTEYVEQGFVKAPAFPDGRVYIVLDGAEYSTDNGVIVKMKPWLSGPVAQEFSTNIDLTDSKGNKHPHISLRAGFRVYGSGHAQFELVMENTWAYEPNPRNFTYDVTVEIAGKVVFQQKNVTHYHHARWRKVFWMGEEPAVHIKHHVPYLLSTMAVANYSIDAAPTEDVLQALEKEWTPDKAKLMGIGLAFPGMAETAGRRDIGLLPGWAVMYLLSQDPRAAMVTNGTADQAGSWPTHYRDKDTDQPVSVIDYPYAWLPGGTTSNSFNRDLKPGRQEAFPALLGENNTPLPESSHQPQLAYLSYLLTGDRYYLEEAQFWAMWNIIAINPSSQYRQNIKGLVWNHQIRAQAWSLRSLIDCAYITPENDRLKDHFTKLVNSNLDYYIDRYSDNPEANKLGVPDNGGAFPYYGNTALATWQLGFLIAVFGQAVDKGFPKAEKIHKWFGKFTANTLIGEGVDWRAAANYSYVVRSSSKSPIFLNPAEAFRATIEQSKIGTKEERETVRVVNSKQQTLSGYPSSVTGYGANIQPAVASIAKYWPAAWEQFDSREIKPDYRTGPQFAIEPRQTV